MIGFLSLFFHVLASAFKTQARLEAEIVLLRHQLNVLRRRVASKPRLMATDRLLFVWLYRLFPQCWVPSPLFSQTRSSGGIGQASACTGAGGPDHWVGARRFRWRFAG